MGWNGWFKGACAPIESRGWRATRYAVLKVLTLYEGWGVQLYAESIEIFPSACHIRGAWRGRVAAGEPGPCVVAVYFGSRIGLRLGACRGRLSRQAHPPLGGRWLGGMPDHAIYAGLAVFGRAGRDQTDTADSRASAGLADPPQPVDTALGRALGSGFSYRRGTGAAEPLCVAQ